MYVNACPVRELQLRFTHDCVPGGLGLFCCCRRTLCASRRRRSTCRSSEVYSGSVDPLSRLCLAPFSFSPHRLAIASHSCCVRWRHSLTSFNCDTSFSSSLSLHLTRLRIWGDSVGVRCTSSRRCRLWTGLQWSISLPPIETWGSGERVRRTL